MERCSEGEGGKIDGNGIEGISSMPRFDIIAECTSIISERATS